MLFAEFCALCCVVVFCVIGDSISKNNVTRSRCVFMVVGCMCMSGCSSTGFGSGGQERGENCFFSLLGALWQCGGLVGS